MQGSLGRLVRGTHRGLHTSPLSLCQDVGKDMVAPPQTTSSPQAQWEEVVDSKTKQVYYWNRGTGETTALGEPKPGPAGRQHQNQLKSVQPSLLGLVGMGAGVGLVFGLIGKLF